MDRSIEISSSETIAAASFFSSEPNPFGLRDAHMNMVVTTPSKCRGAQMAERRPARYIQRPDARWPGAADSRSIATGPEAARVEGINRDRLDTLTSAASSGTSTPSVISVVE